MTMRTLSIDELAQRCAEETSKFTHQQLSDPQFCFELFRRALRYEVSEAFTRVYQIFEPQVLSWVHRHTRFSHTGENASYFANAAMSSFYFAVRGTRFEQFALLSQLLAYLKMCVHTSIAQYVRDQEAVALVELDETIPADGAAATPPPDTGAGDLWAHILRLLPDETDRLLAQCVFVQALKPAQIRALYPERWASEREISVALQRIRRTLRRDAALQEWSGG